MPGGLGDQRVYLGDTGRGFLLLWNCFTAPRVVDFWGCVDCGPHCGYLFMGCYEGVATDMGFSIEMDRRRSNNILSP
jgi:hypothetical protein